MKPAKIEPPSLDDKIFSTCMSQDCNDDCDCEKISYNDLVRYFLLVMEASEDLFSEEEFYQPQGVQEDRG